MKRILLALASLALLAGITTSAMAASGNTTLTFGITVNISAFDIDIAGVTATVPWGAIAPAVPSYSNLGQGQPRSTVTQNGYATIRLTAMATVAGPGPWVLVSTAPALANEVRLSAIFTAPLTTADAPADPQYARDLVAGDFDSTDILTGAAQTASTTVFSRPAGELAMFQGIGITPAVNVRNLRYMIDAPVSGDTTQHTFSVTITGII